MPNLFPILIEVEEIAVGRVLRKVSAMEGVAHIRLRLQEEKRQQLESPDDIEDQQVTAPIKSSLPKKIDGRIFRFKNLSQSPVYQALAAILQHTPAHVNLLRKAARQVGINEDRTNAYVYRMERKGWVKRTSPGNYKMTDKGMREFFSPSKAKKLPPKNFLRIVDNHSGFRHFLLTTLKKEQDNDPDQIGLISRIDMLRLIEEGKYTSGNLWNTGVKMVGEGLINSANGFYSITEKGVEALQPLSNMQSDIIDNSNEEGLAANG